MKQWLLAGCLALGANAAVADELPLGWTLLDQFDRPYTEDAQLKVLLVARDMEGGRLVQQVLSTLPAKTLEQHHAVFVADISRMPGPISTLFARPAMRRYNYRVLLDTTPRVVQQVTVPAGQVAWLQIEQGRVTAQRDLASADALRQALEEARP